jgi:hypothetical protein
MPSDQNLSQLCPWWRNELAAGEVGPGRGDKRHTCVIDLTTLRFMLVDRSGRSSASGYGGARRWQLWLLKIRWGVRWFRETNERVGSRGVGRGARSARTAPRSSGAGSSPRGRNGGCSGDVDVQSAPHAKHIASQISWLNTHGPSVRIRKHASQFSLKLTKDKKRLDKTWNLPGGTRQFRIYGYKASQNDI